MSQIHLKKKYLYGIILLTLAQALAMIPVSIDADEPSEKPVANPIKPPARESQSTHVYQSPEKMLYWPINKPVWLRLAEAPDENAKSYPLEQVSKVKIEEEEEIVKNGLKLDVEGSQFVRWINIVLKQEINFHFSADGKAPEPTITYFNAPSYSDSQMKYFGKGLNAKVTATDAQSGVESIFHSVDGKPFEPYLKELSFPEEKKYTVFYWAKDHVGYISDIENDTFHIDLSPPSSTISTTPDRIESNLSPRSKLFISSNDKLAGVLSTHYRFDDQEHYNAYQNQVDLADLGDGDHFLDFYSIDRVNNQENFQSYHFYLDRTPPTISYTFIGPNHRVDREMFISPTTMFALTATDSKVDVKEVRYKLGEGNYNRYSNPLSFAKSKGKISVTYIASDTLDNESAPSTANFTMDDVAPESGYEFEGPQYSAKNKVIFIPKKTKLKLNAKDSQAGVSVIFYQMAESLDQPYTTPIVFDAEGRFMIRYWAKDNVDNLGKIGNLLLIVDNTPPKIFALFNTERLEDIEKDKQKYQNYNLGTSLIINAADNSSGIEKISYSWGGKEFHDYKEKIPLKEAGFFSLTIKAADHVGNTTEKNLLIHVKDPKHA